MYGQSLIAQERKMLAERYVNCVTCGRRATRVIWQGRFCCDRHN